MKILYFVLFILILPSCSSTKDKELEILNKYSKIEFNDSSIRILKFSRLNGGFFDKETSISAIYSLTEKIDIYNLKKSLINLGYRRLPINSDEGILKGSFNNYFDKSDEGFYKIKINYAKGTQEWIIIDFTKKIIILEVNL